MPDTVIVLFAPGKGDHPQSISDAAQQDKPQQQAVVLPEIRDKHQPAPTDEEVKRVMQRTPAARPQHGHRRHTQQNHAPLHAKQRDAQNPSHIHQKHRGKRAADQQIDGHIVKPAAHPFGGGPGAHGMVDTAHGHHEDQADAVHTGGQDLHPRIRLHQQQHHSRHRHQGPRAVAYGVENLLRQCQMRRLVHGPKAGLSHGTESVQTILICNGRCSHNVSPRFSGFPVQR